MSKHRKHQSSPVAHAPAQSPDPSSPPATPPSVPTVGRVGWRLAAVLGASVVLGFAFNSSSPLGIRFETESEPALTATPAPSPLPAAPPPPTVAAVTSRVEVLAPGAAVAPAQTPPTEKPLSVAVTTPFPSASLPRPHPPLTPVVSPPPPHGAAATPPPQNPAPIHWAEARPLVETGQAVLVDVRHKAMYDAGHIPGAVSLPETSPPEEFTAFLNQHPTNLTLIVYCSSVSCSQSARVANRFVAQYQRPSVKYMTGGYQEYQQAQQSQPKAP